MSPWFIPAIAVLVALVAAVADLRSGRIPNVLTVSTSLMGLTWHTVAHGLAGAVESLVALAVCIAVPGIVYRASQGNAIGGGDIKLFAALGALLGPMHGLEVELSAFLLIGVYALFSLAFRGQLGRTLIRALWVTVGLFLPRQRQKLRDDGVGMVSMRMGPAIALAVVTVLCLPYLALWLPWLG
jgi:prepilin peptidase CpaA